MKNVIVIVICCAVALGATAALVHAQAQGGVQGSDPGATPAVSVTPGPGSPGANVDVGRLAGELANPALLIAVLTTLLFGGVGGIVYELLSLQGNIEWPHPATADEVSQAYPNAIVRNLYDLGIVGRVLTGAFAAVAAYIVFTPDSALKLIGLSLVIGSAGVSFFRAFEDRLLAATATERSQTAQQELEQRRQESATRSNLTAQAAALVDDGLAKLNQTQQPVRSLLPGRQTTQPPSVPDALRTLATASTILRQM